MESNWTSVAARGAASELIACGHLMAKGWYVYRSESPAAPFDLAAYQLGELLRVEVKTISWPSVRTLPTISWPVNDEWDLLIVVCDDGSCVEITTKDRAAARDQLCTHLGLDLPKGYPAPLDPEVIEKIRELRGQGLSQSKIEEQTGVPQPKISAILRGKVPRAVGS